LKQVLLNLVMNAIQATPQGGTVLLAAREDGNKVTIEVHDQGCGISEDSLDRIFDPSSPPKRPAPVWDCPWRTRS
jgi:signal transduction histidine kinase